MKILAVSLLRIGDLLMHQEILTKCRQQYSGCEIHLLINESSKSILPVFNVGIQKVYLFPREELQQILVEQNRSIFSAYQKINDLVQNLNGEKYDLVLNLTHNFLSAHLMDLLHAGEKRGIHFQDGKVVQLENRWLGYFNNVYSHTQNSTFHYLDVLARGLYFDSSIGPIAPQSDKKYICLQVLTSDEKKNWSLKRFSQLADLLVRSYPEYKIVVLGAPYERELIEGQFSSQVELLFVSWIEAQSILKQTRLLITGDTSTQHLAVNQGVPILSIFLGSANISKTGPRVKDARLLTATAPCYPCSHKSPCSQESHMCAEMLTVQDVFENVQFLFGNKSEISPGANYRAYRVIEREGLYFTHQEGEFEMTQLEREVRQVTWQFYLDREMDQPIPPFGSATRTIMDHVNMDKVSTLQLETKIDQLESALMWLEEIGQQVGRQSQICVIANADVDGRKFIQPIQELFVQYIGVNHIEAEYIQGIHNVLKDSNSVPFTFIRQFRAALKESLDLIQIDLKLTKCLLISKQERGSHVSRARELS